MRSVTALSTCRASGSMSFGCAFFAPGLVVPCGCEAGSCAPASAHTPTARAAATIRNRRFLFIGPSLGFATGLPPDHEEASGNRFCDSGFFSHPTCLTRWAQQSGGYCAHLRETEPTEAKPLLSCVH